MSKNIEEAIQSYVCYLLYHNGGALPANLIQHYAQAGGWSSEVIAQAIRSLLSDGRVYLGDKLYICLSPEHNKYTYPYFDLED